MTLPQLLFKTGFTSKTRCPGPVQGVRETVQPSKGELGNATDLCSGSPHQVQGQRQASLDLLDSLKPTQNLFLSLPA